MPLCHACHPSAAPTSVAALDEHETAGACLTWLRDSLLFPDDGLRPTDGPGPVGPPEAVFDRLNQLAGTVPAGAGGVLFTPWLNGERSPVGTEGEGEWVREGDSAHPTGIGPDGVEFAALSV